MPTAVPANPGPRQDTPAGSPPHLLKILKLLEVDPESSGQGLATCLGLAWQKRYSQACTPLGWVSTRNGNHRDDPGATPTRPDPQVAAELLQAGMHARNADAEPDRSVGSDRAGHAVPVVPDADDRADPDMIRAAIETREAPACR